MANEAFIHLQQSAGALLGSVMLIAVVFLVARIARVRQTLAFALAFALALAPMGLMLILGPGLGLVQIY